MERRREKKCGQLNKTFTIAVNKTILFEFSYLHMTREPSVIH